MGRSREPARARGAALIVLRSIACLLLAAAAPAQRGDQPGEPQPPLPADLVVPPAPVLSAAQAQASFTLPEGLRIELVASEPLVEDPVAMTFGPDGRLWVVEMRGFMPNVDGEGEDARNGRIVVLTDRDGDGRMDDSAIFLDGLVLPRAVALHRDGVLVIEPPDLCLWRDSDGDGRGDQRTKIAGGFDEGLHNVEHAGNGLLRGLDNWLHLARYPARFREIGGAWVSAPALGGGQWGLAQDDSGRLFYNYNSDWLRADLVPSHYAVRNPDLGRALGCNVQLDGDQSVWPGRVTPGINRGYRAGMLAAGKLTSFTAVCAPLVYRGDALPDLRGDVFVCEPAANLVRRGVLEERDGALRARNAYERREFLTSTDERFRPVNLADGPDGALYVVDMYRGIVQHRNFVTSWLRAQILERGLDRPLGLGRIWRIVPADWRRPPMPDLAGESSGALVAALAAANGWRRDAAQRLLVERGDRSTAPALRVLARGGAFPANAHALWTLEGTGALDRYAILAALADRDPRVRMHALRLSEGRLRERDVAVLARVLQLVDDADRSVRRQLVATLGEITEPAAQRALVALALREADDAELRSLVLSGLGGRELEFLEAVLAAAPALAGSGERALLRDLARCIVKARAPARTERLLLLAAQPHDAVALLEGALAALPDGAARKGSLPLMLPSPALARLGALGDERCRALSAELSAAAQAVASVSPLTSSEQARFATGRRLFLETCAGCHLAAGTGMDGLAPSLKDSPWVLGPVSRLACIVLHGVRGASDARFAGTMDGWGRYGDEDLAALLTYLRRDWGHSADPVAAADVAAVRAAHRARRTPWTAAELRGLR
jgi:mono/diheme cytochrome c family protein/glucose/arabinose dehydrogenase